MVGRTWTVLFGGDGLPDSVTDPAQPDGLNGQHAYFFCAFVGPDTSSTSKPADFWLGNGLAPFALILPQGGNVPPESVEGLLAFKVLGPATCGDREAIEVARLWKGVFRPKGTRTVQEFHDHAVLVFDARNGILLKVTGRLTHMYFTPGPGSPVPDPKIMYDYEFRLKTSDARGADPRQGRVPQVGQSDPSELLLPPRDASRWK